MSSSWMRSDERSQTEPIAALIAVSTVALALSLYGVVVLDVLNQDTDRELADPTVDRVWGDIRVDGVYDATGESLEAQLEDALQDDSPPFPYGHSVYVEFVYLNDNGEMTVVDSAAFVVNDDPDGPAWTPVSDDELPPAQADTAARPVPIRLAPADVQTGTVRVEVWG